MKRLVIGSIGIVIVMMTLSNPAIAQELSNANIMDDVLDRFRSATSTWRVAIEAAASRLFWTLTVISMIWTFGMMALRKADIGEFFAEFFRFIMFTGFFWWLLTNANQGMNIAGSIVDSLQTLGAQAGGLSSTKLGPSEVIDLGFQLYEKTKIATSELGWRHMATKLIMYLMALAILFVMALIAVNLLLTLISAWILLYAGIFFLGFGGSRWTSDIAISYYKAVLGIAAQLMAMILLVSIGKQFLNHYYAQISNSMSSQELSVMFVVSIILMFLVNKVPPMIAGLISGGGGGAGGIGNFGAGAAIGAAATAASVAMGAAAMAGRALAGAAEGIMGGAQALKAAFSQASENVQNGTDALSGLMGGSSGGASNSSSEAGTSTPLSEAAGFGGSSSPGGFGGFDGGGGSSSNDHSDSGSNNATSSDASSDSGSGGNSSSDGSKSGQDPSSQQSAPGSTGPGMMATAAAALGKAGRIAADTGVNLAKGASGIAKKKISDRIANTTGGKIATAIKASKAQSQSNTPTFGNNSLSGVDVQSEVAAFANRNKKYS